jgi:hypothetical protein
MAADATEQPNIDKAKQRRADLRNRLGPPSSTLETLNESIQQLQGLARDRSDAVLTLGKQPRKSRRG